jgi:uncharacterized membrane protein YesL
MCIPIFTIFPATAAMFAVVRQWIRQQDSSSVFKPFFFYFKENFKQSFVTGVLWLVVTYLIIFNFQMIFAMESSVLKTIMLPFLTVFSIFFLLTSLYLFPVMVHYKLTIKGVLRNAFLLSVSKLHICVLCLLFIGLAVVLFFMYTLTVLISFSLVAYFMYRVCHNSFPSIQESAQEC